MKEQPKQKWKPPVILYEEPEYPGGPVSPIPCFYSKKDADAPVGIFLLEYKHTGEYEQGSRGAQEEIMDGPYPHMYVEFDYVVEALKEKFPQLDMNTLVDDVREALGLKPLKEARAAGEKTLLKVEAKASELENKARATQSERVSKIEQLKKDLN